MTDVHHGYIEPPFYCALLGEQNNYTTRELNHNANWGVGDKLKAGKQGTKYFGTTITYCCIRSLLVPYAEKRILMILG